MKKVTLGLSISLALASVSGCSVVKVTEAGKRVNILNNNQVYQCTRLGTVTTSVVDNILFVSRNEEKIKVELDKLAKDQAVLMEANALVRVSIEEGQGQYLAYRCPEGVGRNTPPGTAPREGTSVIAHPVE